MPTPVNPILDGMMNAFQIANMFQQQRTQQQQLAMEQARQQQQAQMQNADLQMRLNASGARPVTPSDDLEAQMGQRIQFNPVRQQIGGGQATPENANYAGSGDLGSLSGDLGSLPQQTTSMLPSFTPSDIGGRMLTIPGSKQRYVLPSQDDRDAMADRQSNRELSAKVKETKALGDVKTQGAIAETQAKLKAFGIPIGADNAKLLGIDPNTTILPEHMDDYMRAIASAKASAAKEDNNVVHAVPMYGDKQSGVATVMKDGTVKWNAIDLGGKPYAPARPETPNEKRLTQKDAEGRLLQETASQYLSQSKDEDEAVKKMRADAQGNADGAPYLKKNLLPLIKAIRGGAPKGAAKPANDPQAISDQIDAALGNGQPKQQASGTPAGGPPPPVKPSKGKATGDQIRAFAQARKIDFQTAVKQAKAEGYDVSGLETKPSGQR